jgi:hypothetical protein
MIAALPALLPPPPWAAPGVDDEQPQSANRIATEPKIRAIEIPQSLEY